MGLLIVLSVLVGLGVASVVMMRSQVRYLRKQAEGKDDEGRARLLRDFLHFGGG